MKNVKVKFVSVWEWVENGSDRIETNALLDLSTGVLEIEGSDLNCDSLVEEYIEVKGKKYSSFEENGEWKVSMDDLREIIWELES